MQTEQYLCDWNIMAGQFVSIRKSGESIEEKLKRSKEQRIVTEEAERLKDIVSDKKDIGFPVPKIDELLHVLEEIRDELDINMGIVSYLQNLASDDKLSPAEEERRLEKLTCDLRTKIDGINPSSQLKDLVNLRHTFTRQLEIAITSKNIITHIRSHSTPADNTDQILHTDQIIQSNRNRLVERYTMINSMARDYKKLTEKIYRLKIVDPKTNEYRDAMLTDIKNTLLEMADYRPKRSVHYSTTLIKNEGINGCIKCAQCGHRISDHYDRTGKDPTCYNLVRINEYIEDSPANLMVLCDECFNQWCKKRGEYSAHAVVLMLFDVVVSNCDKCEEIISLCDDVQNKLSDEIFSGGDEWV